MMDDQYIVCPCCGVKINITKGGIALSGGAFFNEKPDKELAEALKAYGYEFGVTGGESE